MKIFVLILALCGAYYAYAVQRDNPEVVTDPVYLETRVKVDIPKFGRELEYVLLGEMVSMDDCRERAQRFPEDVLSECTICEASHHSSCKTSLPQRYLKLFDGKSTHTTHLSLTKGSRYERDGRMVIWGLNAREADFACEQIRKDVLKTYSGTATCVAGTL